ncbi:retrovirus-related pol polyprotein from transposon TNT 1-94 [Tanacetum coccineum]
MKKKYCLVVTDDYSRFTWVFFLATKDETCGILKYFISGIENLIAHKVKVIRCDNGTELKNREMNQFYEMKGILRQFSVARTPQQNGVADRRNRTLIEAVRTMLADSKLPTIFRQKQLILLAMCNIEYHLSKFDGKANEGFFVGYSLNSKAFRVFNSRTRIVEKNLHIRFSENIPNAVGSGPDWLFDIDSLTRTMNYEPIVAGTQSNGFADNVNNTNNVNAASTNEVNAVGGKTSIKLPFDPNMSALEDYSIFDFSRDNEDVGAEADINNLDTTIQVSPIPTIRIHKDHPLNQVIRDFQSDTQTRRMSKNLEEHGFEEPKKVIHALKDPSSIEAIQEELLQFKLQEVWTLVDLPIGKRAIRSKWVFQNKKNERGIVIRNKARLVAQGYQVIPKVSHLYAVKRNFRYLKGQPKLGLWYPKDSFFDLVAYTDSDYAGASLDRKSTTRGCQFLGSRLISWQCKKQTVVANSTTEVEYVVASSCCGQVVAVDGSDGMKRGYQGRCLGEVVS